MICSFVNDLVNQVGLKWWHGRNATGLCEGNAEGHVCGGASVCGAQQSAVDGWVAEHRQGLPESEV